MTHRNCAVAVLLATLAALMVAPASALDYPTKRVTFVVPYAAGGATDPIARATASEFSKLFGDAVTIVENRPGNGGLTGAAQVAGGEPDGHLLLICEAGPVVLAPYLRAKMPFNPRTDLTPIALIGQTPLLFAAHPKTGFDTLPKLVAAAKEKPGTVRMAHPGTGTVLHVAGAMLQTSAKIELLEVPYRGGGPAVSDTLAGHTDFVITSAPTVQQFFKAGTLLPVVVLSDKRVDDLPNVQTAVEAGYPDMIATGWWVVYAPKGIGPDLRRTLADSFAKLADSKTHRAALAAAGVRQSIETGDNLARFLDGEYSKWKTVIEQANIKIE